MERNKRSFLALFNVKAIIILSCLTVFLSFRIFFLIKFILWNSGKAQEANGFLCTRSNRG